MLPLREGNVVDGRRVLDERRPDVVLRDPDDAGAGGVRTMDEEATSQRGLPGPDRRQRFVHDYHAGAVGAPAFGSGPPAVHEAEPHGLEVVVLDAV